MFLNNKGITIVESLVAILLVGVAIVGLLTMQPLSWQSAGKADSITRATELLQTELESVEASIMSGINSGLNKTNSHITMGNETFTMNTTVSVRDASSWLVHTVVTWPGNTTGVKSSIIVTRQAGF